MFNFAFGPFLKLVSFFKEVLRIEDKRIINMSQSEMISYLAQSNDLTPFSIGSNIPASLDTDLVWRTHDIGQTNDENDGYEASDSVVNFSTTSPLIIQTFDFGYAPATFGHFDIKDGDGGQVIEIIDGWASVLMTRDGGDGLQWFIGSVKNDLGWLMFRDDINENWKSTIVDLSKSYIHNERPWFYNFAYTRYRKMKVTLPIFIRGIQQSIQTFDAVVCEHYDNKDVTQATALERFVFVKGMGLTYWQRYQNSIDVSHDSLSLIAQNNGVFKRLPDVPELNEEIPSSWVMTDGRCWTNFVHYANSISVRKFNWDDLLYLVANY